MAMPSQSRSWPASSRSGHGVSKSFYPSTRKNKRDLHGQRCPNALSTIWHLSFKSLSPESAALLGILAYINPDSVAQELFTKAEKDSLPALLRTSTNELDFYDVVEPLLTLALVKRDKTTKTFSTHRLVQTQYRYQLARSERQEAFDQAVKLMAEGFGRVHSQLYDRWGRCQIYMQQILALKNNFKAERKEADPIHPTLAFCWLLADSSR